MSDLESDLHARAQRAGDAARDEARLRLRSLPAPTAPPRAHRHQRWIAGRTPMVVTLASVLVAAVAAVGVVIDRQPVPVIDDVGTSPDLTGPAVPAAPVAKDGVLPVPPVGDALAAYLDDGRPVFVSHPSQGEVVVLDATNPHHLDGWQHLTAFCPSSGLFEDPRDGVRFTGWGDWESGPAPAGLGTYPSERVADDQVRVTGRRGEYPERPKGDDADQALRGPRGPECAIEEQVFHQPPADAPQVDGTAISGPQWTWAVVVFGGTLDAPLACDTDGICPDDAPEVSGIEGLDPTIVLDRTPHVVLVRRSAEGNVEVLVPASDELHPGTAGWREGAFRVVPDPGTAMPVYLNDGAPVYLVNGDEGVHVLGATSPPNPTRLVGWCADSGAFTDVHGGYFRSDGAPLTGGSDGLDRYPFELVELGEQVAIQITGDPVAGSTDSDFVPKGPEPECGQIVGHQPTHRDHIYENVSVSGEHWIWVRMSLERDDDELYLCAGRDAPCGDDAFHAGCREDFDAPRGGVCEPYRDPVVATPGTEPVDTRQLLLVRSDDGGRTVEIRLPIAE